MSLRFIVKVQRLIFESSLTTLFAVKNNYRVVVERRLRDQRPLVGEIIVVSEASPSAANPTVTGRA